MRARPLVLTGALLVALVSLSCDNVVKPRYPDVPESWQLVPLSGFSFYAPPELQSVPVQGIDSYVGEFKMLGLWLDFDYGYYSGWLEGDYVPIKGAYASTLVIQRDTSQTDSFPNLAILCSRRQKSFEPSLYMQVRCATEQDLKTGVLILRSVEFK